MVAAVRKARVEVPNGKSLLYETTDEESTIRGSQKLDHTKQLRYKNNDLRNYIMLVKV